MSNHEINLRCQLDSVSSDAWVKLDQLDDLPSDVGMRVLKIILEFACIAQHIGAIEAGRAAFERIPLEWLVKYLQDVVGQTLDLTDEWQFRRLLELVMDIMPDKFKIYIDLGLASGLAEIVSPQTNFDRGIVEPWNNEDYQYAYSPSYDP